DAPPSAAAAEARRQEGAKACPAASGAAAADPGLPPEHTASTRSPTGPVGTSANGHGTNAGAGAGPVTRGERRISGAVERLARKPQALSRRRPPARRRRTRGAPLLGRPQRAGARLCRHLELRLSGSRPVRRRDDAGRHLAALSSRDAPAGNAGVGDNPLQPAAVNPRFVIPGRGPPGRAQGPPEDRLRPRA